MPNPLFSNATSPNGSTQPENPLNHSVKRYRRGYNRFNLSRQFYNTERYADINLIEVLNGVEGDVLPFGNKHLIRSYTLNSPIMFDIYKKKTYFMVDNKAILPVNWEKIYKQPNKGDDVPDNANSVSSRFLIAFSSFFAKINDGFLDTPSAENFNLLWRYLFLFESIFSNGSLLASMNCHLSPLILVKDSADSFDTWLETTLSYFTTHYFAVKFPQLSARYFSGASTDITISARQLFDMMRSYPDFICYYTGSDGSISNYNYLLGRLKLLSLSIDPNTLDDDDVLNYERLIAYQLVCAQFYTNDSVDNVYTAELFMQNFKEIAMKAMYSFVPGTAIWPRFTYNGVKTDYDVFSGHIFDFILDIFFGLVNVLDSSTDQLSAYNYLHGIFFFRKSLRYGDYFVGAKTLPYAPGDVTADVVNNGVSALDMTRRILVQRFYNAVERARNTFKDYLKDVTDGVAPPNPLEPRFLASSTSSVSGFEVENTAQNQFSNNNISTILKSGNSNYVYEVNVGSPCIIIGVSTYEVPRVYSRTVDRFFHHRDRFDMFNKFMQNIGDQEISLGERSSAFAWNRIFGYTPRHMEYKQRYPVAAGGFVEDLEGYAFITDNVKSGQNDVDFSNAGVQISSFYIRSKNSEMDRFYSSLTGLGLAKYFHFIVKYDCICHASRQMEYSPTIL